MNPTLARWNALTPETAAASILPCCGSRAWARSLAAHRPIETPESLSHLSDTIWAALPREAWQEAFESHPRIGQTHAKATPQSLAWSAAEQGTPDEAARTALAEANHRYEQRFGRIFIVCATGKSPAEMLSILESRLPNDSETELLETVEQQRQITQLRLTRWLAQDTP